MQKAYLYNNILTSSWTRFGVCLSPATMSSKWIFSNVKHLRLLKAEKFWN